MKNVRKTIYFFIPILILITASIIAIFTSTFNDTGRDGFFARKRGTSCDNRSQYLDNGNCVSKQDDTVYVKDPNESKCKSGTLSTDPQYSKEKNNNVDKRICCRPAGGTPTNKATSGCCYGTYYDSNSTTCVTCGLENKTPENNRCCPGLVNDVTTNKCVKSCPTGTSYVSNGNKCLVKDGGTTDSSTKCQSGNINSSKYCCVNSGNPSNNNASGCCDGLSYINNQCVPYREVTNPTGGGGLGCCWSDSRTGDRTACKYISKNDYDNNKSAFRCDNSRSHLFIKTSADAGLFSNVRNNNGYQENDIVCCH
jgi:hypothetical protein